MSSHLLFYLRIHFSIQPPNFLCIRTHNTTRGRFLPQPWRPPPRTTAPGRPPTPATSSPATSRPLCCCPHERTR
ncbi:hypothetical protein BRADI_5g03214v3 [Brachypodium distachyon]|uniref:Uncharacterized protein n=1 Tax=Brachypodium distachyon TaxID=15368 RepID=A0A2K2CF70_BRADI|nr:hypothetical protein BRADI_5g03214v3 [Brachypodium distachyon]